MFNNRFLTSVTISILLLALGRVHAADNYIFSYTNGRNDVAWVQITDTGSKFQPGQPRFFTSSARIGTTSPQLIQLNGVQKVWVHHNFVGSNNKPVYGIAKFDYATGQLDQALPVPGFAMTRFDIQKVFTGSDRVLIARGNDAFSFLLNATTGIPGGPASVFKNASKSDGIVGADVANDGSVAIQSLAKATNSSAQVATFINDLVFTNLTNGKASGPKETIATGETPKYAPVISDSTANSSLVAAPFRLVAYRGFKNVGTTNQQSAVFTIVIDEATGAPIGPAKQLTKFVAAPNGPAESFPSIAVAPNGSFIIYTVYNRSCNKQIVFVQRVNPATGAKIGKATALFGCSKLTNITIGFYGIDLAQLL